MGGRTAIFRFGDLTGGEASIYPHTAFRSKFSILLQNAYITERGGIGKIPGYTAVNSVAVAEALYTGFEMMKNDGTSQILVAGGGKIYKGYETLVAIKTGLDASAKCYFSQINDVVIITNGVDPPMKYDGVSVTTLGGTPPATAFKSHVHKGRVWMIERSNRMLATHSALRNPEDYTGAGSGYIDFQFILNGGDELIDIVTFVDLLIFIFRTHIAIYSGDTPSGTDADFKLEQLIEGVGAIGTGVVKGLGTDLAYLSEGGCKSMRQVISTGNMSVNDLSKSNDPAIQEIVRAYPGGPYSIAHYPRRGWLLIHIRDVVLIYSYVWKAWSRIVGADIKGMFTDTKGNLYFLGTGRFYKFDSGDGKYSFNGAPIPWIWQTAWFAISRAGQKAYPKLAEIVANQQGAEAPIDLATEYDLRPAHEECRTTFINSVGATAIDDVTDWDALLLLDEDLTRAFRVPLFGGGRVVRFTFSNTSTVGPIEINDIILQCVMGGL